MSDPYTILGISSSATDDEVKKAYRTLSKKYHPDMNINNPNKEETTKKFKEVQNAYDQIMDMRKHGYTNANQYQQQYSQSNNYYEQRQYADMNDFFSDFFSNAYRNQYQGNQYQSKEDGYYSAVINYINQGYYEEALNVLSSIENRNGRWYYYSAIANARLGNNAKAMDHARTAVSLEPNNLAYQQLVDELSRGRSRYQSHYRSYGSPMSNYGNCCYQVLLFNLLCNCCCGIRIC